MHEKRFTGNNIVAVTGGTTMEAVAEMMTPDAKTAIRCLSLREAVLGRM